MGMQRVWTRLIVVAVVALAAIGIGAPTASAAGDAIRGTVTSAALGLEGVTVTVYDGMQTPVGTGTTAVDGTYEITALPPGTYRVGFAKPGYVTVYGGGASSLWNAATYTLGMGVDPVVDATMVLGASISGQILGSGAVQPFASAGASGPNASFFSAFTDPVTGAYTIGGLPAGQYSVRLSSAGFVEQTLNVTLTAGQHLTGVSADLQPQPRIEGTVRDGNGDPIPYATVGAYTFMSSYPAVSVIANDVGFYSLNLFQPGTVSVGAKAPGLAQTFSDGTFWPSPTNAVTLAAGQVLTGQDLTLTAAPGSISGVVRSTAGAIIPNAFVSLYRQVTGTTFPQPVTNVMAGPDASYTFADLGPGTYFVSASAMGYLQEYYDNAEAGDATPIVVTSGASTPIDITLGTGGTVIASVSNAAGTPLTFGTSVQLRRWPSGNSVMSFPSQAGGVFTFTGVPAGQYVLLGAGPGGAPVYSGGSSTFAGATPFTVLDGVTSGPFVLTLGALGTVRGQVTLPNGTPAAGFTVNSFDPATFGSQASDETDEFGNYELTGVAGNLRITAYGPQNGEWLPGYWTAAGGSYLEADAELLVVAGGQVVEDIDIRLTRGGSVAGRLTGPEGRPFAGLFVGLRSGAGGFGGSTTTDADGRFLIRGVPPGTDYSVGVDNVPGFFNAYSGGATSFDDATPFAVALGQDITGQDLQLQRSATASVRIEPAPAPGTFGGINGCPGTTLTLSGFWIACDGGALPVSSLSGNRPGGSLLGPLGIGTYTFANTTFSGLGPTVSVNVTSLGDHVSCVVAPPGSPPGSGGCTVAAGGAVAGRISGPNGVNPGQAVQVEVVDSTSGRLLGLTLSDALGFYKVTGLPAGQVKIKFAPFQGSAYSLQWYVDAIDEAGATPVDVVAGQTTDGLNVQLDRAVTGIVRFLDDNGNPITTTSMTGPVVCPTSPDNQGISCGAGGGSFAPFQAVPGQPGVFRVGPISAGIYDIVPIVNLSQSGAEVTFTVQSGETFDCTMRVGTGAPSCNVFVDPDVGGPQTDTDGISDDTENGGVPERDGNGDTIPDAEQPNVTSLPALEQPTGDEYITIAAPAGTLLSNVAVLPTPDDPPAGAVTEVGLIKFDIPGLPVDEINPAEVDVTIHLPIGVQPSGYVKYMAGGWGEPLDSTYYTIGGDALTGYTITLHLVDGDPLVDADGAVNGTIVDPGIPLVETTSPITFVGFTSPVDMGDVVNVVKGGATVPLKFEMFRDGVELTDVADVHSFRVVGSSTCGANPTDDLTTSLTSNTSLRYEDGRFIQNWKTPKIVGCYRVEVTASDGSVLSALFRLR